MVPVNSEYDIFHYYHHTPVGRLLKYHNLGYPFDEYDKAQLLIGMCMDNRHQLKYPMLCQWVRLATSPSLAIAIVAWSTFMPVANSSSTGW